MTSENDEAVRRAKLIGVAGAALSLLALVALIWLFGPGDDSGSKSVDTDELATVDGTLTLVEDRRLILEPFTPLDGEDEIEFTIRDEDVQNFDLAHLQSHSAVALPTRIYYEKQAATYYAVYKEDAPANSAQP